MKLEISYKETGKTTKIWRLNNMLLNNQWSSNKLNEKSNEKSEHT